VRSCCLLGRGDLRGGGSASACRRRVATRYRRRSVGVSFSGRGRRVRNNTKTKLDFVVQYIFRDAFVQLAILEP
jgi:hypothetical protein